MYLQAYVAWRQGVPASTQNAEQQLTTQVHVDQLLLLNSACSMLWTSCCFHIWRCQPGKACSCFAPNGLLVITLKSLHEVGCTFQGLKACLGLKAMHATLNFSASLFCQADISIQQTVTVSHLKELHVSHAAKLWEIAICLASILRSHCIKAPLTWPGWGLHR